MSSDTQIAAPSAGARWSGRVISALPVLMLLFGASLALAKPPAVVQGFTQLGWPPRLATPLAIVEICCTLLYVIPSTSVLGAVLLTGYFGGATATHVRIGQPFFLPVIFGVLVWLGLVLREPRLRALLPLRG